MLESTKSNKPTPLPSKVANPLSHLDKRCYADLTRHRGYTDEEIKAVLADMTVQ
jgi:hypothetical protein